MSKETYSWSVLSFSLICVLVFFGAMALCHLILPFLPSLSPPVSSIEATNLIKSVCLLPHTCFFLMYLYSKFSKKGKVEQ